MKTSLHRTQFMKIFIIIISIILSSIIYSIIFYTTSNKRLLSMLDELSEQSVLVLQKEVGKEKEILLNVAQVIENQHISAPAECVPLLNDLLEINLFKRMGIIDKTGQAATTDGLLMDLSDREYFQQSMAGETVIAGTLSDKFGGENITVYSTPLYYNNHIIGVLFATYDTAQYRTSLSTKTFGGNGYTCVIQSDGKLIVDNADKGLKNGNDFMNDVRNLDSRNQVPMEELSTAIEKGANDSLVYYNGERTYMYYRPLGVNDWYLLSNVPASVLNREISGNLILFYVYILICSIIVILLILRIYQLGKSSQKALEDIAYIDKITGGVSFAKWLMDADILLRQSQGADYAIIALNIDKFKYINDLYGFEEGNHALRFIWQSIGRYMGRLDLFTRQNGDHFLLLVNYATKEELSEKAEKICKTIRDRNSETEKFYRLKPSVGIYCIEGGVSDITTMVDRANTALASIKTNIFEHIAFYDSGLRDSVLKNKELEDCFNEAIHNQEFLVYYQPQYDTKEKCFHGAEALVRWKSEKYGMVSPGDFIPVFERSSNILTLDRYVFRMVCMQIQTWLKNGWKVTPISVNLSRLHLYQTSFIDQYLDILEEYQIPSSLVNLELTETALFEIDEQIQESICRLRRHGIRILMDDFGSGYSSINMLKSIPIDVLKIDKSLVDDCTTNLHSKTIIASIISLSHQLGIQVTAEGIETQDQFDLICSMECDYIQGYYCSHPIPQSEYEALIKNGSKL